MTFDMDQPYETAKGIALSDTLFDQMPDPDNPDGWYEVINYDRLIAAIAGALRTYGDERAAEMRERAAQYLEQETDRPSDRSGELFWYVDKLLLDLAGAIRGLGMEKELGR